jgi:hypothetical protein
MQVQWIYSSPRSFTQVMLKGIAQVNDLRIDI